MPSKSEASYNAVFKAVKDCFPNLKPTMIMADFEAALRNSLKRFFPGSELKSCW